jgi:ATP-binding cassette subfamily F protein 3
MQSIDALCDAIEGFSGATIIVTHSEMLLRRLADALIIFHQGKAEYFEGSYDDFLEKIGWEEEEDSKPKKEKNVNSNHSKEYKKKRASLIQERSKRGKSHKKEIELCEKTIISLEKEIEEKTKLLENCSDNSQLIETSNDIAKLNSEVESYFKRLEVASAKLKTVEDKYEKLLEDLC